MSEEWDVDASDEPGLPEDVSGFATSDSRQRSSIRFPYNDLADVEHLAQVMHERRGSQTETKLLASDMNMTFTSGGFRNKINAAVTFGVLETIRGEGAVRLTALGEQLADPLRRDDARIEAFLHVPLYRQVYEKFKGAKLPGDSGLENEMVRMGVAPKQAARARQAMSRSADLAGFYWSGRDRLSPPSRRDPVAPLPVAEDGATSQARVDPAPSPVMNHPLIAGLLAVLPRPCLLYTSPSPRD